MSIRFVASAGLRACIILAAALGGIPTATAQATSGAQATTAQPSLQQQRDAFRAAYAVARKGGDWRPLAKGLETYPLYPYLEAAALQHDIQTAPRAEVDAYLQRYDGTIPADDLRGAELRWLAKQRDWTGFQHFYRPGLGDTLTCYALQARIAQGEPLDFDRDLAELWQDTSLPSACQPVLNAAFVQGLLTPQRVWDRIERAADAGSSSAITQSAAWLKDDDARSARRIAEALASPTGLLKKAESFADTPRNRDAVSRALVRLARRDSARAIDEWQSLSKRFAFDETQRNRVLAALALYNAVDFGPDPITRLAALPADAQTDATREWRVRAAVAEGDWKAAQAAVNALTPDELQHDEWRYWRARVAEKLGQAATARNEYAKLAQQATFYGFLAADRAGLPYTICPETIAADAVADTKIEALPGFARAFEFFELNMLHAARREWERAFPDLSPAEQRQAAALASRKGWYDRAIFAFGKSGDVQYYALRFPLADEDRVREAASAAGIDPAWAFAIIRAETAWQPDARSGADARGLMQLLPGTAKLVSRRSGLPYPGPSSLYDPAINIPLGTRYLAHLGLRFDGSQWLTSAAYNAGPGNAQRWVDARGNLDPEVFILTIPFNETRDYVTRVMSFATIYGWRLHGATVPVSSRLTAIGTPYDATIDPPRKQVVCQASAPAAPAGSVAAPLFPAPARSASP